MDILTNLVKVKNIHGTSKERYSKSYPKEYRSWIDYWEENCLLSFMLDKCANTACSGEQEVGAHVIKEGTENDRSWYIVPLCKKCNHPSNEKKFTVDKEFLVPVSEKDVK